MEPAARPARSLLPLVIAILALQAWTLYRVESRMAIESPADPAQGATAPLAVSPNASDALAAALTRMDARLATLEFDAARRENATPTSASKAQVPEEVPVGSPAALAADRNIARLLPGGSLTQEELQQVYVAIAQQPADQRGALMAALSRAINDGRVRIRP